MYFIQEKTMHGLREYGTSQALAQGIFLQDVGGDSTETGHDWLTGSSCLG